MIGSGGIPEFFVIPDAKLFDYLLKLDHENGGSKARFFYGFGFSSDAADVLARALLSHATIQNLIREGVTPIGDRKLIFEGEIAAPNGRTPKVRTIWRIDRDGTARFVTATLVGPHSVVRVQS